jgi:hypothetical protein
MFVSCNWRKTFTLGLNCLGVSPWQPSHPQACFFSIVVQQQRYQSGHLDLQGYVCSKQVNRMFNLFISALFLSCWVFVLIPSTICLQDVACIMS